MIFSISSTCWQIWDAERGAAARAGSSMLGQDSPLEQSWTPWQTAVALSLSRASVAKTMACFKDPALSGGGDVGKGKGGGGTLRRAAQTEASQPPPNLASQAAAQAASSLSSSRFCSPLMKATTPQQGRQMSKAAAVLRPTTGPPSTLPRRH